MTRERITDYVDHYFPVVLVLLLVFVQWTAVTATIGYNQMRIPGADVVFALFTFWLWALTTNWHSRRLAAWSGEREGSDLERKREGKVILLLLLLTLGVYLFCYWSPVRPYSLVVATIYTYIPFWFMERPS